MPPGQFTVTHVDDLIKKLLEVRGNRPGKTVDLKIWEVAGLCTLVRNILIMQPILLELEAPIKVSWHFKDMHRL